MNKIVWFLSMIGCTSLLGQAVPSADYAGEKTEYKIGPTIISSTVETISKRDFRKMMKQVELVDDFELEYEKELYLVVDEAKLSPREEILRGYEIKRRFRIPDSIKILDFTNFVTLEKGFQGLYNRYDELIFLGKSGRFIEIGEYLPIEEDSYPILVQRFPCLLSLGNVLLVV